MKQNISFYSLCFLNLCVILYASFQPVLTVETISQGDKIAHFSAYSTLTVLFFLANNKVVHRNLFFVFALMLGVLIEYVQMHLPGRVMSGADVVANISGCLFGAFIGVKYASQIKLLASKIFPYFFKP